MAGLIFVPVSAAELRGWAESGTLPGPVGGFASTPALLDAFGLDDPASEEAEYTALCIASIAGLIAHGTRIVAVATGNSRPGADEFGGVVADALPYRAVESLFGEDTDPAPAARARDAIAGLSLAEAWDAPAVTALLADTDLLWYGPEEWQQLA